MNEDVRNFLFAVGGVILLILAGAAMVILPTLWFQGTAKSSWIRETRGIEIPWHEAAWLDVEVTDNTNHYGEHIHRDE